MSRSDKDRIVRRALLEFYYKGFEKSGTLWMGADDLGPKIGYDQNDIDYGWERMIEDGVLDSDSHRYMARISSSGIEELQSQGFKTLLEADTRYDLLRHVYEEERARGGRAYVSRQSLLTALKQYTEAAVDANAFYLQSKGLAKLTVGMGAPYFDIKLTTAGAKAFEAYEEHGITFPGSATRETVRQRTIGPNQRRQAVNLFNDIVELASKRVTLVDAYARLPVFAMLGRVAPRIEVRILTSDAVVDAAYKTAVTDEKTKRKMEVRALPRKDVTFHSRYLLRDEDYGWIWDHSFHDAGETQHTVTEIKPVNMPLVLAEVNAAWARATVV